MRTLSVCSGWNLVKKFIVEKSSLQPYGPSQDGVLSTIASNLAWIKSLPTEERLRIKEKMEAPMEEDGWKASFLQLEEHCYAGVILSGFGVAMVFMPTSWHGYANASLLAAIARGNSEFVKKHWDMGSRVFITEWWLACYLRLYERIEKLAEKEPENPILLQLIQDARRLFQGWETGEWIPVREFFEIVIRWDLPWIDDVEEKARLIKKYGFSSMFFRRPEIKKKDLPVIFLGEISEDEILAQMEIWCYRQGQKIGFHHLCNYLKRWVRDEDLVQEVATKLWKKWKTPKSQYSFRATCQLLCREIRHKEKGKSVQLVPLDDLEEYSTEDLMRGAGTNVRADFSISFPCSVPTAALALSVVTGASPVLIERWLYRKMKKGVIPGCYSGFVVADDGFAKEKNVYTLDEDEFQKALELFPKRRRSLHDARKYQLISQVMLIRKVGRRAAQRWVKRRLSAGKTTDEIWRELFQKAKRGGSAP